MEEATAVVGKVEGEEKVGVSKLKVGVVALGSVIGVKLGKVILGKEIDVKLGNVMLANEYEVYE